MIPVHVCLPSIVNITSIITITGFFQSSLAPDIKFFNDLIGDMLVNAFMLHGDAGIELESIPLSA